MSIVVRLRAEVAGCVVASALVALPAAAEPERRPNILLIVADDLGFSDLGAFGGEMATPTLDELAQTGRVLSNFYTAPTCSPTRAMLMSGIDHHLAGVGTMRERIAPEQQGREGYEGTLSERVATLPALLKDAGYRTYLAGKWHLGGAPAERPNARGFTRSFALVPGGAAHFAQTLSALAPGAPEPTYLENDAPVPVPKGFFSSETFTDKLLGYLEADRKDGAPFFAYLAFTAPHWPIQAPDKYLARVRGRYDRGYEVLAKERFARLKTLGLTAKHAQLPPLPAGTPKWEGLSGDERARQARIFEAYAAAVESLDDNVARVVQYLRDTGELERTVVVFFADNGAEGNDISKGTSSAGDPAAFDAWLGANFDNRLDNIGRAGSYVWVGSGFGQASALPNRLYKGTTTEGGIRVPAFVRYPGKVAPGATRAIITVRDVLPTLLELAGTRHPGIAYHGAPVLPLQGTSALAHLTGKERTVHNDDEPFGTELFGRSALRKGRYKLVRLYPPAGDGSFQLFDLESDPGELVNLASPRELAGPKGKLYAQKLDELRRDFAAYVAHNNVIELGHDFGYGYAPASAQVSAQR